MQSGVPRETHWSSTIFTFFYLYLRSQFLWKAKTTERREIAAVIVICCCYGTDAADLTAAGGSN